MRQAVTIMMLGLCGIAAGAWVSKAAPPAGEPSVVAQARQSLQKGDGRKALELLEDALIDGPTRDRTAVVALLRQVYLRMVREAEAQGRRDEAARYRDDLAILDRARALPVRAGQGPASSSIPAPQAARTSTAEQARSSEASSPETLKPPTPGDEPPDEAIPPEVRAPMSNPGLYEPLPLPEPETLPKPEPTTAPTPAPATIPELVPPIASEPTDEKQINPAEGLGAASPSTESEPAPEVARPIPPRSRKIDVEGIARSASSVPPPSRKIDEGIARTASTEPDPKIELATADQFFRVQNFNEAGRIYEALASRKQLPADRRPHWAYCRFKAVVRQINAGPRSSREWDAIVAEVRSIQQLQPDNWYSEYLINKIAEARRSRRRRRRAPREKLVVRGSSPEEPAPPIPPRGRARERPRSRPIGGTHAPSPEPGPVRPPASTPARGSLLLPDASDQEPPPTTPAARVPAAPGSDGISWQVHDATNFRVYHCDPALAERAAAVAESARAAQARQWGSSAVRAAWSPHCEIYIYPTADSFAKATGQPPTSPGISTMSSDGVRVIERRINLRADNPLMLTTTLPHEVTHIVLADLFVAQIPRWADEGLAVLAEPEAERQHRLADLKEPLESGRVFDAGQLMAMDYPSEKDWRLFYAQSVSLTQFLVAQGPHERFIRFVRESQRMGAEAALRDVYQIDGLAVLQQRWLEYAREQSPTELATTAEATTADQETRRE